MKRILLATLFSVVALTSFACDICGCSSGNYFIGPFPQFRKHFIGTRYTFRSFTSHVLNSDEFSKDFYQTTEIWGGYRIGRKWQVLAFVPYNFNRQMSDDGTRYSNGFGDVTLLGNYKVLDNRKEDKHNNNISQQLWLGAGVKLPTGKFAADPDDVIPDANNQPGTGSVDLVLNGMYTFHINNWGINSNVDYKINNSANEFRFGNRLSTSAYVFHTFTMGDKASLNPNLGIQYEHMQSNQLGKAAIEDTGGHSLMAAAGSELNFSKMAIGFNAQLPVDQNLSNHQTRSNVRGMVHLTFLF